MATSRRQEIARAVEAHRAGRFEEARAVYARILEQDPDCAEALNFLAVMHAQHGNPRMAAALLQRAVRASPGYADAHANLGNVLVELGHAEDAVTAYENALVCDPDHPVAHNNLGALLRHQGELQRALQHLLRAGVLRPDWAAAQLNAGNVFSLMGYADRALKSYRRAVELDPRLGEAQRILGHALAARGERRAAADVFRKLLAVDPENVVARHMLAAVSGREVPPQASREYVELTFDQFAASFDKKLEKLEYRAPRLIGEEIARRLPSTGKALRCLDLGCGTGLCAAFLAERARELVGVDLSQQMLRQAAQRECYHQLVKSELVEFLEQPGEPFDLMVSADVLIYFGDLAAFLRGAARRLAPGGWLFFSLECWEGEPGEPAEGSGYRLQPHGRYAHRRDYVEREVAAAGLELAGISQEVLRSELQQPVAGWLVSARKPGPEPAQTRERRET